MREIAVVSGKGGTGKTTVAASFMSFAHECVIADCDVDASNLPIFLTPRSIEQTPIVGSTVAVVDRDMCNSCGKCFNACRFDAIDGALAIDEQRCEGCGVCAYVCPTDAITMEERVAGTLHRSTTRFGPFIYMDMRYGEEGSGKLVTAVREKAHEVAEESGAETIIIDGPPGIGCPVIASLTGADLALVVCEPTLSGKWDLERVSELAGSLSVPTAVCINKYDINTDMTASITEWCDSNGIPVVGKLPYDIDVYRAIANRKTLPEYGNDVLTSALVDVWDSLAGLLDSQ
ncbi:MAG TPA: (4Fe-4S)-binding protein [Methanomicrobia archaeon]|nr:(4Fe-4S)-binding protein [Methanomicrobia archaeon]